MIRAWTCYLIWLAAVLGANIFLNTAETALLLILSIVIPLIGIVIYFAVPPAISIKVTFPESTDKKQTVKGEIWIQNRSILPYIRVCFSLYGKNQITGETMEFLIKGSVPSRGATRLSVKMRDDFCGKIIFSASPVKVYDMFLLSFRKKSVPVEGSILVLPDWLPHEIPPFFAGETDIEATEYAADQPGIDRSEPFGYREYHPGDSPKDIHWKLTQKLGHMTVREGGNPVSKSVLLLLDTSAGEQRPDYALRDSMLEVFVTVSRSLLSQGTAHTMAWQDQNKREWISYDIRSEDDFESVLSQILSASMEQDQISCLEHYWENCPADRVDNVICVLHTMPSLEMARDQKITILLAESQKKHDRYREGSAEIVPFTPQELQDDLFCLSI